MKPSSISLAVVAVLLALAASPLAGAADPAMPHGTSKASDREMIKSAMRAAPAKVAAGATIVAIDKDGKMRTLREGKNGFTCLPDNPATPGPDPMCMDKAALEWAEAWMAHKTPASGKVGFMYMLAGGTDASNTDPYATKPGPDKHWVKTGAHVMVVGAEPAFYDKYPKGADPDTTETYVMWAGTPYQHLMVPIK
jgi:hypothetical protein